MRTLVKTLGWLVVSGLIIFFSNLLGGSTVLHALYGALLGKIGTTFAYYFYEVGFEQHSNKLTSLFVKQNTETEQESILRLWGYDYEEIPATD